MVSTGLRVDELYHLLYLQNCSVRLLDSLTSTLSVPDAAVCTICCLLASQVHAHWPQIGVTANGCVHGRPGRQLSVGLLAHTNGCSVVSRWGPALLGCMYAGWLSACAVSVARLPANERACASGLWGATWLILLECMTASGSASGPVRMGST